jgi:hypothetical protein
MTAPAGTQLNRAPLATPCPGCAQQPIFRFDDDLGALYQCPATGCPWERFIAWTDLEPRTSAPAGPTNVNSSRTGGPMTVKLPTAPRISEGDPQTARIMLIGHPKTGKSTFAASWAPKDTLLIDTHGGTRLLPGEHYVQDVDNFADFTATVDQIATGQHPFKTIVVDTIDDVYKFADAEAGARHKKIAAGLVEYGKGTAEAEALFRQQLNRLLAAPLGVWFIGHADDMQIDSQTRFIPKLDKRVRTFVQGACDYVWFAERLGPNTFLHTQPTAKFEAGSRTPMPDGLSLDAKAVYAAMRAGLKQPTAAPHTETEQQKVAA